jgi:hypothetical protein
MTRQPCSSLVAFSLLVLSVSFAAKSNGQHLDRGMELLRAGKSMLFKSLRFPSRRMRRMFKPIMR